MDNSIPSPREFLKARRPEYFSDSVIEKENELDRSMLEYHLNSLTSRSQENEFQEFARHLAEREICPNLLPQTGPTGGGDSKVDTETYPVADSLSVLWYTGIGRESATERWGFAISAKKDWRTKVLSDVSKIVATARGYKKIFFITNQYIKDKERAKVEDDLRRKYKCDIRILNRTWILDRIFKNGHQELAINDLKLSTSVRQQVRKGPLDLQREQDLAELEQRINEAQETQELNFQSVQNCIDAAILARSLNRPRTEVDGRFLRAQRVAKLHGTTHQRLVSVYQEAWTCYWWYEDYQQFVDFYPRAEEHAIGSENVYDFELLSNLWVILSSMVRTGTVQYSDLSHKTNTLEVELSRLSEETNRPSSSLQARTLFLLIRLHASLPGNVDGTLRKFRDVVKESRGLIGYPLEPLIQILTELGDLIGERPSYTKLFDEIIDIASSREGEVSAARLLLKRGIQEFRAERPYKAIQILGQSMVRLQKHESRQDAILALTICAAAYEKVGLFWAARGTMLAAASYATNEFWSHSNITFLQASCYQRLKWLELQLGRIPHILVWHELDHTVRKVLATKGYDLKKLRHSESEFDFGLSILFLRSDLWQLNEMTYLPDLLTGLELPASAIALLFALGQEGELPSDLSAGESIEQFFRQCRDIPGSEDLPNRPSLASETKLTLSSSILGCRITLETDNASPCIELAESILAALESLLSTGLSQNLIPGEPILSLQVRSSDFAEKPFSFELKDKDGRPHIDVFSTVFNPHSLSVDTQNEIHHKLFQLITTVLARVFMVSNFENLAKRLFREEKALERAVNFTSSFVTLGNVLGHTPKTRLSAWCESTQWRQYALLRKEAWDIAEQNLSCNLQSKPPSQPSLGVGNASADLITREDTRHSEIAAFSLIRTVLWERAKWSGTGFAEYPQRSEAPIMLLLFQDSESARKIFALWRDELGIEDMKERLRIVIIRGVNKKHPYHYRVAIGINPSAYPMDRFAYTFITYKTNTMTPESQENLERFLRSYQMYGQYFLSYGIEEAGSQRIIMDNAIGKKELHVRNAWEIGRNDPDCASLRKQDDPIIPQEHLKDAPVLEVMKLLRRLR